MRNVTGYADAIIPKGSKIGVEGWHFFDNEDADKSYNPFRPHIIHTDSLIIQDIHLDIKDKYYAQMECFIKTREDRPDFLCKEEIRNPQYLVRPKTQLQNPLSLAKFYYPNSHLRESFHVYVGFSGGILFLIK